MSWIPSSRVAPEQPGEVDGGASLGGNLTYVTTTRRLARCGLRVRRPSIAALWASGSARWESSEARSVGSARCDPSNLAANRVHHRRE
jgi:hypothetical protein